jgi:hypothetical protein
MPLILLAYLTYDLVLNDSTTTLWRNDLHDRIISLIREARAHKTSLTLPHFTKVPVLSQESERPCIYVSGVINCSSFNDFPIRF